MSKPSAKQVISMDKSLEDEIPHYIPDYARELYQFLGASGQAAMRTLQSQQHTPTGYAPQQQIGARLC